jgi:hypothetical protein
MEVMTASEVLNSKISLAAAVTPYSRICWKTLLHRIYECFYLVGRIGVEVERHCKERSIDDRPGKE